jgi:branched-chain amino acid transport system substrate-binding protein
MKKIISGAASAALMTIAGLTMTGTARAETVNVGLIAPFSGPFAVWGKQFKESVEAFQKANGKTVKGHTINVIYRDSGGINPAKSRQHAEELILREKVRFLTGFTMTPNALAVAEIINETKIPAVIMNAATGFIVRKSPYYVRASMTVAQYVKPTGLWAAREGKMKTAYIMVSDYAPGHDAEKYFEKGFIEGGGKIVGKDRMAISTTDFAPYMERASKSGAEAVYIFVPAGAPSTSAIKEFAKRGLKKKGVKLLAGGEVQEIFLPAIGDDVIGTISGVHYTETRDSEANKAFRKALTDTHGPNTVPDMASVGAWDGMKLIYAAVEKFGPKVTGDQAIGMYKGMKWESPRGPVMIDPNERDIVQNVYLRKVEKRDGKLVNIDFFTTKMAKDPWQLENPVKKK